MQSEIWLWLRGLVQGGGRSRRDGEDIGPGEWGAQGPWERAVFTPLGPEVQTSRETPAPGITPPLDRGVLARPLLPGTPTHHPLVHIRPALALQTGLQSLVDIVGCSLGWLQPLLHLGGARGMDPRRLLPPSPLPCSFSEQDPLSSSLLLGTPRPTAWGMTQPRPPTGVPARPSGDSLHGPALPPAAGPGMYLLEVLTQELGSLRLRGADGGWGGRRGELLLSWPRLGPSAPPTEHLNPRCFQHPSQLGPALGGPPAVSQSEHIPWG